MEVSGEPLAPATFPPGKEHLVPIEREPRWVPGADGRKKS
jgi:hypothetical protein